MMIIKAKDHKYDLAEREKYFFELNGQSGVLLKTCNRVALYSGAGPAEPHDVEHLFRITAGLESKLIGESAIQAQVKAAYLKSKTKQKLSKSLHRLFQTALSVGKRVRSETKISRGAVSHSQAAVELLLKKKINIKNARITVVGVHNLNKSIVAYLVKKGAETIFLGNRTYTKTLAIAERYNCERFELDTLPDKLKDTDVLISATSAPHLIVHLHKFPGNKQMTILDLAVPRDVEEGIGLLPEVELYNIEDIEDRVEQNLKKRRKEIIRAEKIIAEEVQKFIQRN